MGRNFKTMNDTITAKVNDGGWAFPRPDGVRYNDQFGMTLRDYFAAKAMASLVSAPSAAKAVSSSIPYDQGIAEMAYTVADAMITEREK